MSTVPFFSNPFQALTEHSVSEMPFQLTPAEQLCYSTVRLTSRYQDGTTGTGSGYFYQFLQQGQQCVPAIVTNKHVVDGAVEGIFNFSLAGAHGEPVHGSHIPIILNGFSERWIRHPDPDVDLCAMPIAPLLHEAQAKGRSFFYVQIDKTLLLSKEEWDGLSALEDVLMVGYPIGLWDAVNNMPILRRGVTATHPNIDYNGKKEFLIDAACFPGSSGSPVLLFNPAGWIDRKGNVNFGSHRIKLLGTLYAGPQHTAEGEIQVVTIPTQQKVIAQSRIPMNLGVVIKSDRLLELEEVIRIQLGM